MRELLLASLVHSLVGALVVRALLRAWAVDRAAERLRLRRLALVLPPVLPIFLSVAWPARSAEPFRADHSLVDTTRLRELSLAGVEADLVLLGLAALAGLILFARDLVPMVTRSRRDRIPGRRALDDAARQGLSERVAALARRRGVPSPAAELVVETDPLLLCRGWLRPEVVVSTGALSRLSPEALDAALAHELSHAVHRDPMRGWVSLGWRALWAWNPAVQVVARGSAAEVERRADEEAAALAGRTPLAEALSTLGPEGEEPRSTAGPALARLSLAAREGQLRRRVERLEQGSSPDGRGAVLRAILAVTGLVALLLFVV